MANMIPKPFFFNFCFTICIKAVGTLLGIIAGYKGGFWDELIMRLVDMTYAIPFLLVALVAAVVFGTSLSLLLILLTIFSWPPFARQTRGLTLQL